MTRWALISSESGADNAACALEVVARLARAGVRAAGYTQRRGRDEADHKCYELVRLSQDQRALLAIDAVVAKGPGEEPFCSMAFHLDGFAEARRWLEEDAAAAHLLVLDGISKLESAGKGHAATLDWALAQSKKPVLICVRQSQLGYVIDKFCLSEDEMVAAVELPASEDALLELVAALERACSGEGVAPST